MHCMDTVLFCKPERDSHSLKPSCTWTRREDFKHRTAPPDMWHVSLLSWKEMGDIFVRTKMSSCVANWRLSSWRERPCDRLEDRKLVIVGGISPDTVTHARLSDYEGYVIWRGCSWRGWRCIHGRWTLGYVVYGKYARYLCRANWTSCYLECMITQRCCIMLGDLRSPLLGLQPVHHIYYINSDARPLMEIKKASMEKWVISPLNQHSVYINPCMNQNSSIYMV
jgi:hypothetical protein